MEKLTNMDREWAGAAGEAERQSGTNPMEQDQHQTWGGDTWKETRGKHRWLWYRNGVRSFLETFTPALPFLFSPPHVLIQDQAVHCGEHG